MKTYLTVRLPLVLLAFASGHAAGPALTLAPDVRSTVGDATHWTASHWSPEDTALFEGIPAYHGPDRDLILLRYSYYVSDYDADRLCPLWVAHIDVGDTSAKARERVKSKDPKWDRIGFYPDPNLVTFSTARHLPYVVDASYSNPNPPGFPGAEGTPTHLTRGHNASNDEMKLEGDEDEGSAAQRESFSLANVSPQTQHHNAPLWAALESDCLAWAAKLGRVAVITGPVFAPDHNPRSPLNVRSVISTHGAKGPQIPVPTHFFKIVIGRIDGQISAVGFLVPHRSDLGKDGYRSYQKPIAEIEQATGLTFLPQETNPAIKTQVDARWLEMIPAPKK